MPMPPSSNQTEQKREKVKRIIIVWVGLHTPSTGTTTQIRAYGVVTSVIEWG